MTYLKSLKLLSLFLFMSLIWATTLTINPTLAQVQTQAQTMTQDEKKSYDPKLAITYPYWRSILKDTVLATGRSDRHPASRLKSDVGTRINRGNNNITRLEGNRILFNKFGKKNKKILKKIKLELAAIPSQVPLDNFSPSQQLAYWLNIRNLAVYEEVVNRYPIRLIKKRIERFNKKKSLTIGGEKMSVNDIEELVKAQFKNPLVIYGFFTGAIGGPNLRNKPFTADTVWEDLEKNGRDFVNSLRGVQFDGELAKISTHYDKHRSFFPNFDTDVMDHMMGLADPFNLPDLNNATQVNPTVSDWYIADLFGGSLGLKSASAVNPGALLDTNSSDNSGTGLPGAYADASGSMFTNSNPSGGAGSFSAMAISTHWKGLPEDVIDYLTEISIRNRRWALKNSTITIDEVEKPEEKNEKNKK